MRILRIIILLLAFLPFAKPTSNPAGKLTVGLYSASYFSLCVIWCTAMILLTVCLGSHDKIKRKHRLTKLFLLGISVLLSLTVLEFMLRSNPQLIPPHVKSSLAAGGAFLDFPSARSSIQHPGVRYPSYPNEKQWMSKSKKNVFASIMPVLYESDDIYQSYEYTTDRDGFANPGNISGSVDLLFIGDSFTAMEHLPHEQRWTALLANLLHKTHISLGKGGISPPESLCILEKFGAQHVPTCLVFTIFEGNDPWDADCWLEWQKSGLSYNSFLLNREPFANRLIVWKWYESFFEKSASQRTYSPSASRQNTMSFMPVFMNRLTLPKEQIRTMPGWQATLESIRKAQTWCKNNHSTLKVLLWPSKAHVYGLYFQSNSMTNELLSLTGKQNDILEAMRYAKALIENCNNIDNLLDDYCRENNIDYTSLTPPLVQALKDKTDVYYFDDIHPNEHGCKAVAEYLADKMSETFSATPHQPESTAVKQPPEK